MKKISKEKIVLFILIILISATLVFLIAFLNGKIQFPFHQNDESKWQSFSSTSTSLIVTWGRILVIKYQRSADLSLPKWRWQYNGYKPKMRVWREFIFIWWIKYLNPPDSRFGGFLCATGIFYSGRLLAAERDRRTADFILETLMP